MTQAEEIAFREGIKDAEQGKSNIKDNSYRDPKLKEAWDHGVFEFLDSKRWY